MNKLEYLNIPMQYEVKKFEADDRFLEIEVKFLHEGVNLNSSNFSSTSIFNAKDTLKNIPILAYIEKKEDESYDFKGHEMELTLEKNEDGKLEIKTKYLEIPIGIIPESNDYSSIVEDGQTYYKCKAYIWKEYSNEALDIIERDKEKSVSMEIKVLDGEWSNELNAYDITNYKYLGITVLGEGINPGIANADMKVVEQFSDNNKKVFAQMAEEINEYLNNQVKGGMTVDVKLELLKQYNLTQEQINFNIDELTVEELESKLKEFQQEPIEETPVVETPKEEFKSTEDNTVVETEPVVEQSQEVQFDFNTMSEKFKKFFELSHDEVRSKIYAKLSVIEDQDEEWYYISNVFDNHFTYENDIWGTEEKKVYKQNYIKTDNDIAFDGDRVRLHRMELTDEEKQAIDMMRMNYSVLETELNTLKESNKNLSEKLSTYQINEISNKKEEVYSLFSDAFSEDEFSIIKDETKDITLENLESELYKYVGKKKYKFSKTEKKEKAVVKFATQEDGESNPYPGLTHIFNKIK